MADHKVDDGLKKEIEAGKTLKDTPVPETGVNTHDATLAGNNLFYISGSLNFYICLKYCVIPPLCFSGITHFNKDKMNTVSFTFLTCGVFFVQ